MRIVNPDTGQEFYLSRLKDGKAPKHIQKTKPVLLIIDKNQLDLYSNPRKSNYAYVHFYGEWMACRDHSIAECGTINCQILDFGRPYKPRKVIEVSPIITVSKHDHKLAQQKEMKPVKEVVIIKKKQHVIQ